MIIIIFMTSAQQLVLFTKVQPRCGISYAAESIFFIGSDFAKSHPLSYVAEVQLVTSGKISCLTHTNIALQYNLNQNIMLQISPIQGAGVKIPTPPWQKGMDP